MTSLFQLNRISSQFPGGTTGVRRLTTLAAACVVLASGTATGQPLPGGFHATNGPFVGVRAGHSTRFDLARAQHPLCLKGLCLGGEPPIVSWGDIEGPSFEKLDSKDCDSIGANCLLYGTHTYQEPGVYMVTVRYRTAWGFYEARTSALVDPDVGPIIHTPLPLPRFNIVSIGDSVASGEGNPEVPWSPNAPAGWSDETDCHRSSKSGPALVADAIRTMNTGTVVNFDHLACSGANTGGVVLQLEEYSRDVPSRTVDALLVSAGANDTDGNENGAFSSVVTTCLGHPNCGGDGALVGQLNKKINRLPSNYQLIADAIDASLHTFADTYITEYYDPTRDLTGGFGDPFQTNCFSDVTLGLISQAEWQFLFHHQVAPMNSMIHDAAVRHGWHLVDGIQQGFVNHGFCAGRQGWVVNAVESIVLQGDQYGTAHPNFAGQSFYADRILRTIYKQTAPRVFVQPLGGSVLDEWTNRDVTVGVEARNLAFAGAVRMDWEVYQGNGPALQWRRSDSVLETVVDDGSCDRCSALTTRLSFTEEGQHLVRLTSTNAWGRRSPVTDIAAKIDKTAPTAEFGTLPTAPNAAGWYSSRVDVPYRVSDMLSGVAGPTVGVMTVGEPPARLTVRDIAGNSRTYDVPVNVDLTPPAMRCRVNPGVISPNGTLVPISASVDVTDTLSGPAGFVLTSVTSSDPRAAGDIQGFVPGTRSKTGSIRARRLRNGTGHVFTLTFTGADVAGNSSRCEAKVTIAPDVRRMAGAGRLLEGTTEYTFEFALRESGPQGRSGHLRVRSGQPGSRDRFVSDAVTSHTFKDDPSTNLTIDSLTFAGTGRFNGKDGYSFRVDAVDRGEAGDGRDTVTIVVRDASRRIVMRASGRLEEGGVQPLRAPRP